MADESFHSARHGLFGKIASDVMRCISFTQELFGGHLAFGPPQIQAAAEHYNGDDIE
jgi:hypothetical protein